MSLLIGQEERQRLMSIALNAAMAAGDGATYEGQRYAECAVRLLRAAIGDPITLAEAQQLLERWTMLGTPLEESFTEAIVAIKNRRQMGDASFGKDAS
jgi:hypothetical protein